MGVLRHFFGEYCLFATSPTDAHTALHARLRFCFVMLLLASRQEVAKKPSFGKPKAQDVPSWISLSVPRYKGNNEIDISFVRTVLQIFPTRAAGADSKKFCGFLKG
jgi:hypothetical protein